MLRKHVEIRGQFFHRCPAWRGQLGSNAAPGSNSSVSPSDCLWEVAPFFSAVLSMDAARWLDSKGGHTQLGSQRIHNLAHILCPGLPARWLPSCKMVAAHGAQGRALIQASDGSTEVPPQPWSLVHQRSGEHVSGETSHSSPPPESPLLEFHSGSGEPVTSGVQGSESAPSQPLAPLTAGTSSWHGSWAFPMRPGI